MIKQLATFLLFAFALNAFAAPHDLSDQNMKIAFEVHSPWNILDGKAQSVSGKLLVDEKQTSDSLSADVSVEKLDYSAGLSVAGRLVESWLESNPPTPAKFVIAKSLLDCKAGAASSDNPCTGSVAGQLTIWSKNYSIDVPVEMKQATNGFLLSGAKEIKWGEYGFGDPESAIADLKPVIKLNFTIDIPAAPGTAK